MTPNLFQSSMEHLKKNGRRASSSRKMTSRLHSANIVSSHADSDSNADTWKHDAYESLNGDESHQTSPKSSSKSETSPALKIENLHYEISQEELSSLVEQFGTVIDGPRIAYDKSGRSLGYAFVRFKEEKHATNAKNHLDGALAKGKNITVTYDFSRPRGAAAIAAAGPLFHRMKLSVKDLDHSDPSKHGLRSGIRGRGRGGSRGRGSARGRDGAGDHKSRSSFNNFRTGGSGRSKSAPIPTTEDLDKQLDDFMGGTSKNDNNSNSNSATKTESVTQDVDMS